MKNLHRAKTEMNTSKEVMNSRSSILFLRQYEIPELTNLYFQAAITMLQSTECQMKGCPVFFQY